MPSLCNETNWILDGYPFYLLGLSSSSKSLKPKNPEVLRLSAPTPHGISNKGKTDPDLNWFNVFPSHVLECPPNVTCSNQKSTMQIGYFITKKNHLASLFKVLTLSKQEHINSILPTDPSKMLTKLTMISMISIYLALISLCIPL